MLNKSRFPDLCFERKPDKVAELLGDTSNEFKASNGWLEKFRNRHAISLRTISGESASIDPKTFEDWSNRFTTILDGYYANHIFNADETDFFYYVLKLLASPIGAHYREVLL